MRKLIVKLLMVLGIIKRQECNRKRKNYPKHTKHRPHHRGVYLLYNNMVIYCKSQASAADLLTQDTGKVFYRQNIYNAIRWNNNEIKKDGVVIAKVYYDNTAS